MSHVPPPPPPVNPWTIRVPSATALVDFPTVPALPARLAATVIAMATLAALVLPFQSVGLAWSLVGLGVTAVVVATAGREMDRWQVAAAVIALAATPLPAFTDALWVQAWALLAWLAALAMVAGPGPVLRPLRRALRLAADTTLGPFAAGRPAVTRLRRSESRAETIRGLAVAAVVVALFAALLASADRVFSALASEWLLPDIDPARVTLRALVGAAVFTVAGGLVLHVHRADAAEEPSPSGVIRRKDWLFALGSLNVLFVAFLAVQATSWFGGDGFVHRTAGLTYAEYARSGFFQLLLVAALVLAIVAVTARWAGPADAIERRLQRSLLGALCGQTLLIVASVFWKLELYERAFGSSRLRLLATAGTVTVATLLLMVLAAGTRKRSPWVVRAGTLATCTIVIALGWARPDAMIAEANVARFHATGELDVVYLAHLSADAVPALTRLPAAERSRVLEAAERLKGRQVASPLGLGDDDGWLELNHARSRARQLLAGDLSP